MNNTQVAVPQGPLIPTCVECFWFRQHPTLIGKGFCFGAPPTPMAVQGPQGAGMMMQRPVLDKMEACCGTFMDHEEAQDWLAGKGDGESANDIDAGDEAGW